MRDRRNVKGGCMSRKVYHPNHYGGKDNIYEAIKIIEAHNLGFDLGNVLKYIVRAGKKNKSTELEDLEKAAWYLNHRINWLRKIKSQSERSRRG